jgi:anti-anti-sigma factor
MDEAYGPDGQVSLALIGELDLAYADEVIERFGELGKAGAHVRLDLSRVTFLDSTGLRAIITGLNSASRDGWQLEIGPEVTRQVRRVLELSGMTGRIWPEGS